MAQQHGSMVAWHFFWSIPCYHTSGQKGVHRMVPKLPLYNCKIADIWLCLWRSSMVAWLLDIFLVNLILPRQWPKRSAPEWCQGCHFFSRGHLLFFLSDNCKVGDISHCLDLVLNGLLTRRNFWRIPGMLGNYTIPKWKEFLKSREPILRKSYLSTFIHINKHWTEQETYLE